MFELIAVGYDGRDGGDDALALASEIAGASGGRLLVAQVRREGFPLAEPAALPEGSEVITLPERTPAEALAKLADQRGADLIVVFFSMVMCQIGVAFATRTERASLRSVGVLRNRLLLAGVAFELALAGILIYLPPVQGVMGTAALGPEELLVTLPFPFIVWGADELRRAWLRRRGGATLHSQVAN